MSHWFYNIISFGGRALPVPVAELDRSDRPFSGGAALAVDGSRA